MVAADPLSEEDLVAARAVLSAGKPFTVWFTSAAVGVPANGSAKVISIDDAAEGDFIQVRPAGTRDTMFCSPSELTRTRSARKRVQRPAEPDPESIAAAESTPPPFVSPAPAKRPDRLRRVGSRPAARPVEVTVTLIATPEGEWTVEVMIGKKRTVRSTPVQPGDVAKAARSLPSAVAQAIESSLEAARGRQLERVERLRAELEAAQRALHELSSDRQP
jgi:hypothetical protein